MIFLVTLEIRFTEVAQPDPTGQTSSSEKEGGGVEAEGTAGVSASASVSESDASSPLELLLGSLGKDRASAGGDGEDDDMMDEFSRMLAQVWHAIPLAPLTPFPSPHDAEVV